MPAVRLSEAERERLRLLLLVVRVVREMGGA
jgi:hypothetical protein